MDHSHTYSHVGEISDRVRERERGGLNQGGEMGGGEIVRTSYKDRY